MILKTLHLMVDRHDLAAQQSRASLRWASEVIRSGGLVAFPTETVYGLGANALDPVAVARIFDAKQRPAWDPLIVHIASSTMVGEVAQSLPLCAAKLMQTFWPGPLTLLVPRHPRVPAIVTAGRERVGLRMPAHPVALELIRMAGVPIAAPSANLFGHTSPTSAAHVLEDLDGRIDAVLDGGLTRIGLESTVVDCCETPVMVYRPGAVTLAQIAEVCGGAQSYTRSPTPGEDPPASLGSPGMALRHYAPHARLLLVEGEGAVQQAAFATAGDGSDGVGWMLPDEFAAAVLERPGVDPALIYRWGPWNDHEELARRLFAGLRHLDNAGATLIVCPLPAASGIAFAIRDRLLRAAN